MEMIRGLEAKCVVVMVDWHGVLVSEGDRRTQKQDSLDGARGG